MKGINKEKERILEKLWRDESPCSLKEIVNKMGLETRSANMHLLGLQKLGYISKSRNGYYTITGLGREVIGFPKLDKIIAKKILSATSPDMTFHFFVGIDKPTSVSASSLVDFCEKISTIDIVSVEFHTTRGDFESWISSLGDQELAKKIGIIRESSLTGEALREKLYRSIKSRCDELLKK